MHTLERVGRDRRRFGRWVTGCVLALAVAPAAHADSIRSFHGATISAPSAAAAGWGQSLVTPSGSSWNNLEFNFYGADGSPVAVGSLFLLSDEFVKVTGLGDNDAFPGYMHFDSKVIAKADAIGGIYVFDPSVTLAPDTPYWFYTGPPSFGEDQTSFIFIAMAGLAPLPEDPAEQAYTAYPSPYESLGAGIRMHYLLQGDAVVSEVPEPGLSVLLITGAGVLLWRGRRNRSTTA